MVFRFAPLPFVACAFNPEVAEVLAMDAPPAPANRPLPWGPADCFVQPTFDPTTRVVMKDVAYGEANNPFGIIHEKQTLKMDVHFPPDSDVRKERPVMVWVHGGAFLGGDKTDDAVVFETLVARGYVVASINYRMVDPGIGIVALESVKPAVVATEDARAAVRFLRMKATEWRLDSDRFVVGGDSAGALTANFYGFTKGYTDGASGNPDYDSAINAVVSVSGSMQDLAFCASIGKAPDFKPFGCVVNSINRGGDLTSEMTTGDVPFVLLHGTSDSTIPYVGAVKMDAQANATGVPHDLITIPGANHVPYGDIFNEQEPYFLRWLHFMSGSLNLAEAECPKSSTVIV